MKTNRLEKSVLAGVLAYLELRTDVFGWRQNTSAGILPSGQFARSNMRGVADWLGLQAVPTPTGVWLGRFTAVETKRERGGKLSPDQERFRDNVVNHGGLYVEARSVDEVAAALGPVRCSIPKIMRQRIIHR